MFARSGWVLVVSLALVGAWAAEASAQTERRPWVQYRDAVSDRVCGLIHGANGEFVVLEETGELTKVSGPDVILSDLLVDEFGNVFYQDDPAGFIEFYEDADGYRALFWLTLTGRLVEIDAFDASPSVSDLAPDDVEDTGCDACPRWDDAHACEENTNGNGNDNSPGGGGGSPITVMCGSGAAGAALVSVALLMAIRMLGFAGPRGMTSGSWGPARSSGSAADQGTAGG